MDAQNLPVCVPGETVSLTSIALALRFAFAGLGHRLTSLVKAMGLGGGALDQKVAA